MTSEVDRAQAIMNAWRRERPDLDPSSVAVITRIWQLAKVLGDDRRRLLASLDVEPALVDLLGTLRRAGDPYTLSTRELAERALVTPAAISQRLARAEQHGWVTRERVANRTVLVRLTGKGRDVIDHIAGEIFNHEDQLLCVLALDQRRELADHLERLVQAIGSENL